MTTITSRQFNQDVSAAKRSASKGPVFITDRGKAAYVLLSIDAYEQLGQTGQQLVDSLCIDDEIEVDFAPINLNLQIPTL